MFKNLIPYKFDKNETDFSKIKILIAKEKDLIFKNIYDYDDYKQGFHPIFGDELIIESDNRILLKTVFASKKVNDATVKLMLNERLEKLKKEKEIDEISVDIKNIYEEQVKRECLQYAPVSMRTVFLLIDKNSSYIYVETGSSDLAEDSLHLLRKLIGKLVCRHIEYPNAGLFLSQFMSGFLPQELLPENLVIPAWPKVSARDGDGIRVKLEGIHRNENYFKEILAGLTTTSVDMSLNANEKNERPALASFVFNLGKNNIFIIKNFSYDETSEQEIIDEDDSYYYTSKMLLVGRYMFNVMDSLDQFFS